MIFSGVFRSYRCQTCAAGFANVTPTSLGPMGIVVAVATAAWTRVWSHLIAVRWGSIGLGLVTAIASLWLIYTLFDAATTRKLRRGVCPACGGPLAGDGGGFYDGIVPNLWELVIYAVTIALAVGAAIIARHHGA